MPKLLIFLFLITTLIYTSPSNIQATTWGGGCVGSRSGIDSDVPTIKGIECVFQSIITYAISFIGIAVLGMLIFGAFKLLMSGGDPKNIEAGRTIVTYALLGLILAISAWFILNLIANFSGATSILNFVVPSQ